MIVPLDVAQTAVINANGIATLVFDIGRANAQWKIKRMITTSNRVVTGNTSLVVYRNSATPGNVIDSTYTADQSISETDIFLRTGERIICVYQNGVKGMNVTFSMTGDVLV